MREVLDVVSQAYKEGRKIFLYGCGKYGLAIYEWLRLNQLENNVTAFVETTKTRAIEPCYKKRIIDLAELLAERKDAFVILAMNEKNRAECLPHLCQGGIPYYIIEKNEMIRITEEVNSVNEGFISEYPADNKVSGDLKHRILVVKMDGLGDVILCTPFLKALRKHRPDSEITMLVANNSYELMKLCPYLDRVLFFDASLYYVFPLRKKAEIIRNFMRETVGSGYDLTIVPRFDVDFYGASLMAFFSGAAQRVTYSEHSTTDKERANKGYDLLFSNVLYPSGVFHETVRDLHLLEATGVNLNEEDMRYACEVWEASESKCKIENCGIFDSTEGIYVVLGMSAAACKRIWPWQRFLRLAQMINESDNLTRIILCGQLANRKEIDNYVDEYGMSDYVFDCLNDTSIMDFVSIMKRSDYYIGNDTGLMHIAAACGKRIIEISCHPQNGNQTRENSPKRFGAWGCENIVLSPKQGIDDCVDECEKDYAHCIKEVTVDDVFKAYMTF